MHYESPQIKDGGAQLYHMLRKTILYQSDEITSATSLRLDGEILATQNSVGIFHLDSDGSRLKIYVPKNEVQREICYNTHLILGLLSNWEIDDTEAASIIGKALRTQRSSALSGILEEDGIPEIPDLQRLVEEESQQESAPDDFEEVFQDYDHLDTRDRSGSVALTSATSSFTASSSFTPAPTISRATTPDTQSASFSAGRRSFYPEVISRGPAEVVVQPDTYVTQYRLLLDKVINAGEDGNLPTNFGSASSRSASSTTVTIDPDTVFGVRSQDMLAHDMRIGAAGELYVR